jgi:uncharacterized Ntn-hydrolase superfamily protein
MKIVTNDFAQTHLAERLISGLEAEVSAGGEAGPIHSAPLIVSDKLPFYLVDLQIDWADKEPVARLRQHWQAYASQMRDYIIRAINPSAAPSYGVVGDP